MIKKIILLIIIIILLMSYGARTRMTPRVVQFRDIGLNIYKVWQ